MIVTTSKGLTETQIFLAKYFSFSERIYYRYLLFIFSSVGKATTKSKLLLVILLGMPVMCCFLLGLDEYRSQVVVVFSMYHDITVRTGDKVKFPEELMWDCVCVVMQWLSVHHPESFVVLLLFILLR